MLKRVEFVKRFIASGPVLHAWEFLTAAIMVLLCLVPVLSS